MERNRSTEAILQASLYFHELFKKTLAANLPAFRFTKTQMDLMVTLHLQGPMNMSTLSEHAGIAPEQASRALKPLRERGLADTVRSDENRRMVIAKLTERGMAMMDEHLRSIERNLRSTLDGLEPDEVERLSEAARTSVELLSRTDLKRIVVAPPKL